MSGGYGGSACVYLIRLPNVQLHLLHSWHAIMCLLWSRCKCMPDLLQSLTKRFSSATVKQAAMLAWMSVNCCACWLHGCDRQHGFSFLLIAPLFQQHLTCRNVFHLPCPPMSPCCYVVRHIAGLCGCAADL